MPLTQLFQSYGQFFTKDVAQSMIDISKNLLTLVRFIIIEMMDSNNLWTDIQRVTP